MTSSIHQAGGKPSAPGWYWFRKKTGSHFDVEWVMVRVYVETGCLMGWIATPSAPGIAPGAPLDSWPCGTWSASLERPPLAREGCPFCGSQDLDRVVDGDSFHIVCRECGGSGPATPVESLAVVGWDHRPRKEARP